MYYLSMNKSVQYLWLLLFLSYLPDDSYSEMLNPEKDNKPVISIVTDENNLVHPKVGFINLSGFINTDYVRLGIEIKPDNSVTGYLYKNKGESIYVYGLWFSEDWLYLYDQRGVQYQIILNNKNDLRQ